jgi:hypothetical protein
LCLAAPAAATIVPGREIAGVNLRMTERQVRAALGAPVRITRWRGALGVLVTRLRYRLLAVDLERLNHRPIVIKVLTSRRDERTASGVGVGASVAAVKRLPGARCWWEGSAHYCGMGNRNKPLSRFTMFWIGRTQRVTSISVSLIVNS